MATRAQAKTAIDSAVVEIKSDIDNILFNGVNILDGSISFGPTRYVIMLDAGGNSSTALTWLATIQTNLTNAGRTNFTVLRNDRRFDDAGKKQIVIRETKLSIVITNF